MRDHLRLASLLTAAIVGSSSLAAVPAASADTGADGIDLTTEEITALVAEVAPAPITATQTSESSGQIVATLMATERPRLPRRRTTESPSARPTVKKRCPCRFPALATLTTRASERTGQ